MPHPAAPAPSRPERPEHEIKLVTPAARAATVARWLAGHCLPDPKYAAGLVTSIYFDNRDVALLRAKINSDFVKRKVRLRWYSDPRSGVPLEPAFVEIKEKVGSRRFKIRKQVAMPAFALAVDSPAQARLRSALSDLRAAGYWVDTDLRPLLRIAFRRRRFVDPVSGSRISVDADIRAASLDPGILPHSHPAPLAHAVIEVKGSSEELPRRLAGLRDLGCHRESFSKYARCYQKIARRSSF